MWDIGSTLGTGGMIVIDDSACMVEVAKKILLNFIIMSRVDNVLLVERVVVGLIKL